MKKKLVIFGAGQIAELAWFYFTHDSEYEVAAFTVDAAYRQAETFHGLPVVAFEEVERAYPSSEYALFVAVSYQRMNAVRAQKVAEAKAKGYALASYVSSRAVWWPQTTKIGENCMIQELNNIQPYVTIGDNVFIWAGNHIGHHSTIGNHVFIASHAVISGNVTIGERCFLGVNATLRDGITIAEECVLGAGVTILKSTNPREVHLAPESRLLPKTSDQLKNL